MHPRLFPLLAALVSVPAFGSDFDVVINEIHYNPLSGLNDDQFVELYNRGGTAVDLSGWIFDDGIDLIIPNGTVIEPKTYLLVSPNAEHTRSRYGVDAVVGDFAGQLSNAGEIVRLRTRLGAVISQVHYGDGGPWPSSPDGLGPSLELTHPHASPDLSRSWQPSRLVDGTPGAENRPRLAVAAADQEVLIADGAMWSYEKGTNPYPEGWNELEFDDGAWATGQAGIGYDDGDDRTELLDMQGGYVSFAARRTFEVREADLGEIRQITLEIQYDDGFVAYLNGTEFARAELGDAGSPVAHNDTTEGTHEADDAELFPVPKELLRAGTNVLAVQVHNADIDSSDCSFIPVLRARIGGDAGGGSSRGSVVINEVKATEPGSAGFVELYNPTRDSVNLSGYRIVDSLGQSSTLDAELIPSGGFASISDGQLGFDVLLSGATYALVAPDGRTYVDGLDPRPGDPGENGYSYGRVPDGDNDAFVLVTPSSGAANTFAPTTSVVINEIHYHPLPVPIDETCARNCSDPDQWIELYNRTADAVDLTDWEITKGIDFAFPAGQTIAAEDYLVVASSRDRFLANHPGVDAAKVVGDWSGAFSHSSDTINLRDSLGNLADRVKYGDGGPVNDEEPADEVDDRTFVGSEWPLDADGTGRTIELVHPGLDNRAGAAWTDGPEGGSPAAANDAYDATPSAVVREATHSPAIPRSGEGVVVECGVSSVSPIVAVRCLWRVDGGGGSGIAPLADDGTGGDAVAGDGRYAGTLPARSAGQIVAYRIEVETADGQTTLVPRAPEVAPYAGFDGPDYLYQVIDSVPPLNGSVNYYLILKDNDWDELSSRDEDSDVLLYGTFIAIDDEGDGTIRHLAGIRYRGSAARGATRKSFRVQFPADRRFEGIQRLNLNSQEIEHEILAADLFRRAGMPSPQEWTVNLTVRGDLDERYIRKERLDQDFLDRYYGPGARSNGNLYRALDPSEPDTPFEADLRYLGPDPESYRLYYRKSSNREEDDYSDVVELTRAFDPDETSDEEFADRLEQLIDVDQWARFFALQACLSNADGSIQNRSGEDYSLYHVPPGSTRPDAGRWVLIPWDIEETYENRTEPLFRSQLQTVRRFLTHPRFARLYYCNLLDLRFGVFSRLETRQRFRLIEPLFGFGTIDGIDQFITARIGFFDENIPQRLGGGTGSAMGDAIIDWGETWMYVRGDAEPSGGTLAWTTVDFDDAGWEAGRSGFGYGDGDDATELLDMRGGYSTVYIRRAFDVADPVLFGNLELAINYDDAFVAFLNGVEVARNNVGAPGDPIAHGDTADGSHEADGVEFFDLSPFANVVEEGTNVLAIVGLNGTLDSTDFSLSPMLRFGAESSQGVGCGEKIYTTQPTVLLTGTADACGATGVQIDGIDVDWDAMAARWSALVSVDVGDNRFEVTSIDTRGDPVESIDVDVRRITGGFTLVSGTLAGDVTWTADGGPYRLTADVTVPAGGSLSIESGTEIFGDPGVSILVDGRIFAEGTAAAPVVFRAGTCDGRWGGIGIEGTGTSPASFTHVFRYCEFDFGDEPAGFAGHIAPTNAKILVEDCRFTRLTTNAIDGVDSRLEVLDSEFKHIQEGVHGTDSTVIILGCRFEEMAGDKDAIDFDGNGTERSRIEGCTFIDGSDDGIDLGRTSVDIRDNVFVNIQDKALSLEGNGPLGAPSVSGNLIYNCGTAMALKNGVTVENSHHNTLVGNQEGINLFSKDGAPDGGHGIFHSTISWNNGIDVKLDDLSTVEFSYSNISDALWPGLGNISLDPLFRDVLAGDYSLRPGSPCIATGLDQSDMGAISFEETPTTPFRRGDADEDGTLTIADAIRTLDWLFASGSGPACRDRMDSNDDGVLNISDPLYSLFFLFGDGDAPPPPYPGPGLDPTGDGLVCP